MRKVIVVGGGAAGLMAAVISKYVYYSPYVGDNGLSL